MAVTVEEKFVKMSGLSFTQTMHHRNPSGLNNKVKWLLSKSRRDLIKLDNICQNKIHRNSFTDVNSYASWVKAEYLAIECIESGVSDPRELYIYKKANKLFPHLHRS